jgi:hypothetical protein
MNTKTITKRSSRGEMDMRMKIGGRMSVNTSWHGNYEWDRKRLQKEI